MIDHLKIVENLKLWAAFSQLGEEDPPTAAAALGCLAMAVRDPEVRPNMCFLYVFFVLMRWSEDYKSSTDFRAVGFADIRYAMFLSFRKRAATLGHSKSKRSHA